MSATLTPSEIAAVRSADKMERVIYPSGSVVAMDGKTRLFATGSAESFAELWRQAEEVRRG